SIRSTRRRVPRFSRSPPRTHLPNDFRRRWNGQPGKFSLDDFYRFTADTADKIVFAKTVRNFERTRQKNQRVVPHGDGNFKWLAAKESLVPVDAAVSTRSNIEAHRVPVVNHDARRTQVSPAFFGIMGDINAAGADAPTAVLLEPTRGRKR